MTVYWGSSLLKNLFSPMKQILLYSHKISVSMYLKITRAPRLKVTTKAIFMKDWIRVSDLGHWGGRRRTCLHTHPQSKQLFKQCDTGVDERASELKILPSAVPQDLKFPQSHHRSSNGNSCIHVTGISMGSSVTIISQIFSSNQLCSLATHNTQQCPKNERPWR